MGNKVFINLINIALKRVDYNNGSDKPKLNLFRDFITPTLEVITLQERSKD